eukprot:Nk52_evm19s216 gene=Nk52_evmTU19s216
MGRNAKRKVAGEQSQEQQKKKKKGTDEQPKVFRADKKINKWIKWAEKSVVDSSKSEYKVPGDSRLARYSLAIGMKLALDAKSGCDALRRLSVFEVLVKYLLDYKLKLKGPLKEMVEVLRLCETSIAEGKTDKEINELIKQAHYESYNDSNENALNGKLEEMVERNMASEMAQRLQFEFEESIDESEEEEGEGEGEDDDQEKYLLGDEDEDKDSQNQDGGQVVGTVSEKDEQNRDSKNYGTKYGTKLKTLLNKELGGSAFTTSRIHMMTSSKRIGKRTSIEDRRLSSCYIHRVKQVGPIKLTPLRSLTERMPMSLWEKKSKNAQGCSPCPWKLWTTWLVVDSACSNIARCVRKLCREGMWLCEWYRLYQSVLP